MEHPTKKPYIVILAGGGGTRLWPKSTKSMPKQFLNLFSRRTLLQETYARVAPLTDNDKIFVVSSNVYKNEILKQLPDLQQGNLILEPEAKNTAPAIGLAAAVISAIDPDAVMHSLHSDHFIGEVDTFQRVLLSASIIAEREEKIILWGVVPTRPASELGYIQSGEELGEINGIPVFKVKGFKEKPNVATAQAYIATGKYFWNHGYFSQKVSVMMNAYKQHMPGFYEGMEQIAAAYGSDTFETVVAEVFSKVENTAVDTGIIEKIQNIAMVPAPYPWSDVGSWDTLYAVLHNNDGTNSVVPGEEYHIGYDTHGCLISADGKMVTTIGLQDMIIVDTPQALMICPKDRAQDIKKLLEQVKDRGRTDLL